MANKVLFPANPLRNLTAIRHASIAPTGREAEED